MHKVRTSDPKLQQYLEVQFFNRPSMPYLRYVNTAYPIEGPKWFVMVEGSWVKYDSHMCESLEQEYTTCLKQ